MKIERTRIHFSATFSLPSPSSELKVPIRELKQPRRQRKWKPHLKNVFALFQTLLLLFHFIQFLNFREFLELILKECI